MEDLFERIAKLESYVESQGPHFVPRAYVVTNSTHVAIMYLPAGHRQDRVTKVIRDVHKFGSEKRMLLGIMEAFRMMEMEARQRSPLILLPDQELNLLNKVFQDHGHYVNMSYEDLLADVWAMYQEFNADAQRAKPGDVLYEQAKQLLEEASSA
jgi:hypothetical protein